MTLPLLAAGRVGDDHIDARLRNEPILWLGTVAEDRRPHTVPVWFLWTDPMITIFCDPRTHKVSNIRRSSAVSVSLDTARYGTDVVLGEGSAMLRDLAEMPRELERFAAKYARALGSQTVDQWTTVFSQPVTVTLSRLIAWRRSIDGSLDYRSLPHR